MSVVAGNSSASHALLSLWIEYHLDGGWWMMAIARYEPENIIRIAIEDGL